MILRSGFIQIENVNNLAFYRRQNRNGIAWKKKDGKSFFSGLPGWIHGYLELNFAIISYLNALFAFTQNPFNRRTYIFAFFFAVRVENAMSLTHVDVFTRFKLIELI